VESVKIELEQRGTARGKLFAARKRRTERGTTPLSQRPSRDVTAYGRVFAAESSREGVESEKKSPGIVGERQGAIPSAEEAGRAWNSSLGPESIT
jgi:hypothetical protein